MMSQMHTEKPGNASERLTSPDLRLRKSTALWGPLQLELINHREGTERGYEAGQAAYQEATGRQGRSAGFISAEILDLFMRIYLDTPRFCPRVCTPKIVNEWRAMFLLGWTSQVLEELASQEIPALAGKQYETPTHTRPSTEQENRRR